MEDPQLITLYVKRRKLHASIHSLRKGYSYVHAKIDDSNRMKHMLCHECGSRTAFKCFKYSSFDSIVAL